MQIDYFTTIAQIINFLILVFLLRHFLYRPVIKLMDEREQKIVSRIQETERKKKEAEEEEASFRKKIEELSKSREEMNAGAAREVEALKAVLMKKGREEVEANIARWYVDLEAQKESLLNDLARKAGAEVYAIARRALQDLADEDLESRIIRIFIKRLQSMDKSERDEVAEFYRDVGQQITVRSTFEIPMEMRHLIEGIVRDQTGVNVAMQYTTSPELISGVEMVARGTRVGWSLSGYLNALQEDLSKGLVEGNAREPGEGR